MSKLSFRARALDASKPMPIYMADEVPDLPDFSAINRAVPQMPTGMEKEEESVSCSEIWNYEYIMSNEGGHFVVIAFGGESVYAAFQTRHNSLYFIFCDVKPSNTHRLGDLLTTCNSFHDNE